MKLLCNIYLCQTSFFSHFPDAKSDLNIMLCGTSRLLFIHFLLRSKSEYYSILYQFLETGFLKNSCSHLACVIFNLIKKGEIFLNVNSFKNIQSAFCLLYLNGPTAPRGQDSYFLNSFSFDHFALSGDLGDLTTYTHKYLLCQDNLYTRS